MIELRKPVVKHGESIHREANFKASPQRLYAALTDPKQFQKVVLLSDAVNKGMVKAPQPAQISALAGGEFSLFGGYISGRQVELVPMCGSSKRSAPPARSLARTLVSIVQRFSARI